MAGREQEPQRPNLPPEIERIMTDATIESGKKFPISSVGYEDGKWSTDPALVSLHYEHLSTPDEKAETYTEIDINRHEWHKANTAGYRLANEIKNSFGEIDTTAKYVSAHSLKSNFLRNWADNHDVSHILPQEITDNDSYSLQTIHVPAKEGLPQKNQITVKSPSWTSTLDMQHATVSYQKNENHKLIISRSGEKSGEAIIRNAEFEDIQAFADLLREGKKLKHAFPPPLK